MKAEKSWPFPFGIQPIINNIINGYEEETKNNKK